MQRLTHHLRGLLVAIAALALTAGLAFAARPSTETGLDRATEAAGKLVPPVTTEVDPTVPEAGAEEQPTADEDLGVPEADAEEVVLDEVVEAGERPLNHGWYVSEAAGAVTPDGYRNHGEYVSEIARGDDGKPGTDEADADEAEADADGSDAEVTLARAKGMDRADQAKARNAERQALRGK